MISIVIPVFGQVEMTHDCINAIRETTQDFELIIVDNGSVPPFQPPFMGFTTTQVIRNAENRGFPVAVNQGIRVANGDTIILLNNDVTVTPGALNQLVSYLNEFSIVGPVTNFCAGMQRVIVPVYNSIEGLNKEAEILKQTDEWQEEVNFVIGFCMAFKKSLYDEIGPFDESLWPCSGEEIDFCLSARKAGHKIGIAHDVYVHHEGSKTFSTMDINYDAICKRTDAHLTKKWGEGFWQRQTIEQKQNVSYGKYSYVDGSLDVTFMDDGANLSIGKFCSIASGCKIILGGNHRGDWLSTFPFPAYFPDSPKIEGYRVSKGDVTIGDDVWIGAGVTILSGVTIGSGTIIGAGSVVAKDVEPYSVVVGNPAEYKHSRFDCETMDRLMELKWWDWSDEVIREAIPFLMSDGVEGLFEFAARKAAV